MDRANLKFEWKMKKLFTFCFLLVSIVAWAQDNSSQSFRHLKKTKLPRAGIEFWYNPGTTTVYDISLKTADAGLLDEIRGIADDEYNIEHGFLVAKTEIAPGDACYVVYIAGWDEGFRFCRPRAEKELGALWPHGLLVVPGEGMVYTRHHRNNFDARRKFRLEKDSIVEVKQPYLYVGLKSKTLREVKIYDNREKSGVIATLPAGYEIEILLAESDRTDGDKGFYLVRTGFGLCGWAELAAAQGTSVDVEGLEYRGD